MADEETRTVKDDVTTVVEELFNGEPEEETVEKPAEEPVEELEASEETTEEVVEEEPKEEVEEEAPEELQPPEHFSVEDKEKFLAIPNEHRAGLLDVRKSLERGFDDKFQGMARVREEQEAVVAIMAPVEAELSRAGLDRVAGIRMLVGTHQALQQNPAAGIAHLITQYGGANAGALVSQLNAHFGVTASNPETEVDEYSDPNIAALNARFDKFEAVQTQTQLNSQQAQQADINNQIQLFQEAKDESGNPKYPHFDTLHVTMGGLMQARMAPDMESAYEMAARANPEIFEQMMKDRDSKVVTDLDAKRKEANAKAKKSSRDVNTSRAAPETPNEVPQKMKDCVEDVYDELVGQS